MKPLDEITIFDGKNLHYEVEDKYIPEILTKDWGMKLNEKEKEFAIETFFWRYGEHDENDNSDLIEWNLDKSQQYQWGFSHGKISFSLNKEEFTIIAAFIRIGCIIAMRIANDKVGSVINAVELLSSIIRIRVLKDYERCVFYQIIILTNNSKSVPLTVDAIKSAYKDVAFKDKNCPYKDIFSCNRFKENACIRDNEGNKTIEDIIQSLIKKKVIYSDSTENGYIYLA